MLWNCGDKLQEKMKLTTCQMFSFMAMLQVTTYVNKKATCSKPVLYISPRTYCIMKQVEMIISFSSFIRFSFPLFFVETRKMMHPNFKKPHFAHMRFIGYNLWNRKSESVWFKSEMFRSEFCGWDEPDAFLASIVGLLEQKTTFQQQERLIAKIRTILLTFYQ